MVARRVMRSIKLIACDVRNFVMSIQQNLLAKLVNRLVVISLREAATQPVLNGG